MRKHGLDRLVEFILWMETVAFWMPLLLQLATIDEEIYNGVSMPLWRAIVISFDDWTRLSCDRDPLTIRSRHACIQTIASKMETFFPYNTEKEHKNSMESTLRDYKSSRKRFCRQHLATVATHTILRPVSFEFPDGGIL